MKTSDEILAEMWQAYVDQQCGWQDAMTYHGHSECDRLGIGLTVVLSGRSHHRIRHPPSRSTSACKRTATDARSAPVTTRQKP